MSTIARERHAACRMTSVRAVLAGAMIASAIVTAVWCRAMAAMGDTPMPGGWMLSAAWLPMCGQTWGAAARAFIGMWSTMTIAMMMPALMRPLERYRALHTRGDVVIAAIAYLAVWIAVGVLVFVCGDALAAWLVRQQPVYARAMPVVGAACLMLAGVWQFAPWKAAHLGCCRAMHSSSAWRDGFAYGLHCVRCCAPWVVVLLVSGVMNLLATTLVTLAISAERMAANAARAARIGGAVCIASGAFQLIAAIR